MARPSGYNEKIAAKICELLITPMFLKEICELDGMPCRHTVMRWLKKHPDFKEDFETAKKIQCDVLVEQIFSIADDAQGDTYADEYGNPKTNFEHINRSRLRVDVRKWYACKVYPKVYGDKQESVEVTTGSDSGKVEIVFRKPDGDTD